MLVEGFLEKTSCFHIPPSSTSHENVKAIEQTNRFFLCRGDVTYCYRAHNLCERMLAPGVGLGDVPRGAIIGISADILLS